MTHLRKLDNKSRGQIMGLLASSNALDREYIVNFLLASLKLMVNCSRADLAVLNGSGNEDAMLVEKASDDSMYALQTMLRFQSAFWNPRYSDWSLPDTSTEVCFEVLVLHQIDTVAPNIFRCVNSTDHVDGINLVRGISKHSAGYIFWSE